MATVVLTAPSPPQSRFTFVDGLRGLAALSIVLFHIWWYEPAPYPALESANWIVEEAVIKIRPWVPLPAHWFEGRTESANSLLDDLFLRLRAGVQVLLVISGFVIAYTLRATWVTPGEIFSFVSRRFVRLVPPYWTVIALIILIDLACRLAWKLDSPVEGDLTLFRVSAHMAFLQDIFGHGALSAGMWTICIEMQFYVIAVIGWGLAQHLFRRPQIEQPRPSPAALITVFVPLAFISLFYWRALDSTSAWVIHFFWMFFLGMLTWWTLDGNLPKPVSYSIYAIALLELIFDATWRHQFFHDWIMQTAASGSEESVESWRYENAIALTTALLILISGQRQKLNQWLNWKWLQYVARISYSLYLIHFPVCHVITTWGWRHFDDSPTPGQALAILTASFVASLFAAHLLYRGVEAPSNRWAAKMKQTPQQLIGKSAAIP